VIIIDNTSFHYSDRVKQLYSDAGVRLLYLPPYPPDFNPIEEFFAELKAYIKEAWPSFEQDPDQGSHAFLRQSSMILVQNSRALKAISAMQV
jgi:transposase